MSNRQFHIDRVERITFDGEIETLSFAQGVNVITGVTNAGKSTWLRMIDYILGKDEKISDIFTDADLAKKYARYDGYFIINGQTHKISRTPYSQGASTKIFIDDIPYNPDEFSHEIFKLLKFPNDIKFAKGNPYTTNWVELTFRIIYRHIYRRDTHWSDIADKQPPNEQYAAQYQLFGIADKIYPQHLSDNIKDEKALSELEIKKIQYTNVLNNIANEMAPKSDVNEFSNVTEDEIIIRINLLEEDLKALENEKIQLVDSAIKNLENVKQEYKIKEIELAAQKADLLKAQDVVQDKIKKTKSSISEFSSTLISINEEINRLKRTKKTGIIADLKITHCPACDQQLSKTHSNTDTCFLCKQDLKEESRSNSDRLDFEISQHEAEKIELEEIIAKLDDDLKVLNHSLSVQRESIGYIERSLAPFRESMYTLTQSKTSDIDEKRGKIGEQIQGYRRLLNNLKYKESLNEEIKTLDQKIKNVNIIQETITNDIDFNAIADDLAEGMQTYVNKVAAVRRDIWSHKGKISITVNDTRVAFYVNNKSWDSLGKLDIDIFLLAYHYGLLTLTNKRQYLYPGLTIIDLPADLGQAQLDSYNYIVTPFIQYCKGMADKKLLQVVITGRSFENLTGVNQINLTHKWR